MTPGVMRFDGISIIEDAEAPRLRRRPPNAEEMARTALAKLQGEIERSTARHKQAVARQFAAARGVSALETFPAGWIVSAKRYWRR